MTLKEFYQQLPSATKDLLFYNINTEILGGLWTTVSTQELTNLSTNTFIIAGSKEISNIVDEYLDLKGLTPAGLTSVQYKTFIVFLYYKYKDKWTKLWSNVFIQDYTPIWNVEGTDSTVHTFEHGKTTTETRNMTDTFNKGSTDTTTIVSDEVNNNRYGFNTSNTNGVPVDKSTHTGSSTVSGTGYDSNVATGTDTFTNTGVDTERTTLTRGMNIGVQSTQNLLEMEIELRKKFNYFKMIQDDIISEMTLNIYI